jgi:hypothetical protein
MSLVISTACHFKVNGICADPRNSRLFAQIAEKLNTPSDDTRRGSTWNQQGD